MEKHKLFVAITFMYVIQLSIAGETVLKFSVEIGKDNDECTVDASKRFDCSPGKSPTKEECEAQGCCTDSSYKDKNGEAGPPFCYYSQSQTDYFVTSKTETEKGIHVGLLRKKPSAQPNDVMVLSMDVTFETDTRLRIRITDANTVNKRWEVPLDVSRDIPGSKNPLYLFDVANATEPFSFNIKRRDSNPTTLLQTAGSFIFADQFLQLSYYLPSKFIYGLGEHRDTLLHSTGWSQFVMWNRDTVPAENTNLYGYHPFYLQMEDNGNSHGVLLLNSNAMEVVLQPAPALTWRTIGGVIDLYMFLGPTPDEVIQQYTEIIGRTFMPPYWGLGFHLCMFGYGSAERTLNVTKKVRSYGIPQDTQWNDYNYMKDKRDWVTDYEKFGNQTAEVEWLHNNGYHYIMIVDPGISNNATPGTYPPYDLGMKLDIFIKDQSGKPLQGKVWPGTTVFPDFSNPKAQEYWTTLAADFHKTVAFDGMWIDMNEISNFVNGSTTGCPPDSPLEHPPYKPNVLGGELYESTICATGQQYISLNYNAHALYGKFETKVSAKALETIRQKRAFVISRSTYPGSGHFGGHWTGDNTASYYDMYKSISAILSMNMYGVSIVGSDICGFRGTATVDMCTRWHQLGAFYTFSRNHNANTGRPQDPAEFGPTSAASTRKALLTRYTLLPYLYTLIHKSHVNGSTVLRPLFFEFPHDKATYGIDTQFMWGAGLLISPVLKMNQVRVVAYFPDGIWYDYYSGMGITSDGVNIDIDAPLDKINLHVRGGYILPWQYPAVQTTISRKNQFGLLVALNFTGEAAGELYNDDGETIDSYGIKTYNSIRFAADQNGVYGFPEFIGYPDEPLLINNVTIFGVERKPLIVTVNTRDVNAFTYNPHTKVILTLLHIIHILR